MNVLTGQALVFPGFMTMTMLSAGARRRTTGYANALVLHAVLINLANHAGRSASWPRRKTAAPRARGGGRCSRTSRSRASCGPGDARVLSRQHPSRPSSDRNWDRVAGLIATLKAGERASATLPSARLKASGKGSGAG